jgi:hypothetical protein
VTLRGVPATPLVPRVALQVFFIVLIWWSGFYKGRRRDAGEGRERNLGEGIA